MESITKVIATIGPSSTEKEVIKNMISHHMDIARLNFSWGTYEWFTQVINNTREAALELDKKVEIIQDLSGPRVQEGGDHHYGGSEDQEVITEKDIADLSFGIEQNVDYIALSFVGGAHDIIKLRQLIKEKGGNQKIIAKIERRIAFENLESILKETDAIMVARGDLGNEYPLEEIPFVQHKIIKASNKAGKMVIVATQMMLSMVENPTPTRAEVSDVAYAVIDGANAIMLSEESAKGKHPVEAVTYLENIALNAEKHFKNHDININ